MKLSSLKFNTIKLTVFGAILLYLGIDLLAWHGPLWHFMYGNRPVAPAPDELVAVVYGEPITRAQLNRHEAEQDALAGRSAPQAARRASMLMELVRAKLLLIRTRYNDTRLPHFRELAEAEVARLASRARTPEQFDAWLRSQGYTNREQYTDRLEVSLRSAALLEKAIAPHCVVTDEEVERVFNQLKSELPAPATRRVRHIFCASLHQEASAVQQKAEGILSRLQAGEDFAELARAHSDDARTAPQGGELGIITDTAERPLSELPLFGDNAIPAGVPTLAQSRWGWHILLADEITPARELTLEECRASIRSSMESVKREQALTAWFTAAVREGFTKKRIQTNVN